MKKFSRVCFPCSCITNGFFRLWCVVNTCSTNGNGITYSTYIYTCSANRNSHRYGYSIANAFAWRSCFTSGLTWKKYSLATNGKFCTSWHLLFLFQFIKTALQ
jgi:hypothetical protein